MASSPQGITVVLRKNLEDWDMDRSFINGCRWSCPSVYLLLTPTPSNATPRFLQINRLYELRLLSTIPLLRRLAHPRLTQSIPDLIQLLHTRRNLALPDVSSRFTDRHVIA